MSKTITSEKKRYLSGSWEGSKMTETAWLFLCGLTGLGFLTILEQQYAPFWEDKEVLKQDKAANCFCSGTSQ